MKMILSFVAIILILFSCGDEQKENTVNETTHNNLTIKMKKKGGVYELPCKVNGVQMKFIFDTGASDVVISATEASFLFKNGYINVEDILGEEKYRIADGSIVNGMIINLNEFEIGGIKLKDIKASVSESAHSPLLMGQSALSKLGPYKIDGNELIILNKDKKDTIDNSKYDYKFELHRSTPFDLIGLILSIICVIWISRQFYIDGLKSLNAFDIIFYLFSMGFIIWTGVNSDMIPRYMPDFIIDEYVGRKYNSAYYLKEEGKYEEALKEIDKGINFDEDCYKCYLIRGEIRRNLNDIKGSIKDATTAIGINKNKIGAYLTRYNSNRDLNNLRGAIIDLDTIIQMDANRYYLSKRAWLKTALDDNNGALIDINDAIKMDNTHYYDYYLRGRIYKSLGKYKKAIDDLNTAIEKTDVNEKRADYLYEIATIQYNRTHNYRECIKVCKKMDKYALDGFYYHLRLSAWAKKKLNDIYGSLADYNKAINIAKNDAELYFSRGVIKHNKLRDYQGAIADYTSAISIDPRHHYALPNRAIAKRNLGLPYRQDYERHCNMGFQESCKELYK